MKITDLDREMFIEDLGKVAGGHSEYMPGGPCMPSEDTMTTLAMGEESGYEPSFPFGSPEEFHSHIEARVAELMGGLQLPSAEDYQP